MLLFKLFPLLVTLARLARGLALIAMTLWFSGLASDPMTIAAQGTVLGTMVIAATISASIVCLLWLALRPICWVALLAVCKFMIRSGAGPLVRFGVWELLSVARFRRGTPREYAGLTRLHQTYRSVDESIRGEILVTACLLARWSQRPLSEEARMFLDTVAANGQRIPRRVFAGVVYQVIEGTTRAHSS